jgi:methylated-DNA-[protein]-cysteine S-methyltransferase
MTSPARFAALIDTVAGPLGLVWSEAGLVRVSLPPASQAKLERDFEAHAVHILPDWIAALARDLNAFLAGEPRGFEDAGLDTAALDDFERVVYAALRAVPWGETLTYGALAARIGSPGAARAIGRAMGRNPWPLIVPCHRVLAADGKPGGFTAPGGRLTKLALLEREGVYVSGSGAAQPGLF